MRRCSLPCVERLMLSDLSGVFLLLYRWRQKFNPDRSRVPLKPEVDHHGTVTPSSQVLDLVLSERTPIVLKEKLACTQTGQRYSEVFQLHPAAGLTNWPRSGAMGAFRYCHSHGQASVCINDSVPQDHWGTLCDGYPGEEDRLGGDVTNDVGRTIVAMGTVVRGDVETVPVVHPPQRVYSSPDVVAVIGRKMADGKCPD